MILAAGIVPTLPQHDLTQVNLTVFLLIPNKAMPGGSGVRTGAHLGGYNSLAQHMCAGLGSFTRYSISLIKQSPLAGLFKFEPEVSSTVICHIPQLLPQGRGGGRSMWMVKQEADRHRLPRQSDLPQPGAHGILLSREEDMPHSVSDAH